VLTEVYRTAADPGKHKETAHYQTWRDTVAEMMAEPPSSVKYNNVLPRIRNTRMLLPDDRWLVCWDSHGPQLHE
jgi:hypothetical protein